MAQQTGFFLQNRNPDVLTSIANLSNDEVFTPPSFANQMLDTVEEAWAKNNNGACIWEDKSVTFVDPFTKSGVFLREITRRLSKGLEKEIPDVQERVNHILTKQVFGTAITQLTALLARRSVYCSKYANGEHSICTEFDSEEGNIWFERTEHTWIDSKTVFQVHATTGEEIEVEEGGRCNYCKAPRDFFERGPEAETYAYPFIHTESAKERTTEWIGREVKFDVVVGNPPYQMKGGAGGTNDSPLYHLFVRQALTLEPRFLAMVIPSRWMAGGRGLDEFRNEMLSDPRMATLVDFPDSSEAFPGVSIKGGVCYFLWNATHTGLCDVTSIAGGERKVQKPRSLSEFDVFVRQEEALGVLRKVQKRASSSVMEIISGDTPFGIATNFPDFHSSRRPDDIELHHVAQGKRHISFTARSNIKKNLELVGTWKVFVPKAYGAGEGYPHQILGKPIIAGPGSVCTQSYLVAGPFSDEESARSFSNYYRSKFFRFLVSVRKISQDAIRSTYKWVPQESNESSVNDQDLYAKYKLTAGEIALVESMIKPMDPEDA